MLVLDTDHLVELDRGSTEGLALQQRLEESGEGIATTDLKIASICLSSNATLLSRNLRDFEKVAGLKVEDWL